MKKWRQENNDRNEGKCRRVAKCSRNLRGMESEELCVPQRLSQHCLSESFFFSIFMVTQKGTINLYSARGERRNFFFPSSSSPFFLLFSLLLLFYYFLFFLSLTFVLDRNTKYHYLKIPLGDVEAENFCLT